MEQFIERLKQGVKNQLGEEYDTPICKQVTKKNDIKLMGFTVPKKGLNIFPTVYIDNYYNKYCTGNLTLDDCIQEIVKIVKDNEVNIDIDMYSDFEVAKKYINCYLVNQEKNKEYINSSGVAYMEFLDLYIIFEIIISDGMSAAISKEMLNVWNTNVSTLYTEALNNMKDKTMFISIVEMLLKNGNISEEEASIMRQYGLPLHVLTNNVTTHGSGQLLISENLKAAEEIFGDKFLIIPSSINEIILLEYIDEKEDIKNLIQQVNTFNVKESEVLSNNLYIYIKGQIFIYNEE